MSRKPRPELVTFQGGPWHGWWLTRPRLEENQAAAKRMGHEPMRAASDEFSGGASLNYVETEHWRTNPEEYGEGRAWQWTTD